MIYNNQDHTWLNIHATYYIKFTDTFSSSEYETSYYKPSLIDKAEVIKFESKVSNIVWYNAKIRSRSTKACRRINKKPAQGLLLIHSGIEATLAITMIHSAICNMGNKTLSTRRYSARLTRHKPEIKMTSRIMQGCISGDSLTTICIKAINLAIQLWFQYQVNYNYPSLD